MNNLQRQFEDFFALLGSPAGWIGLILFSILAVFAIIVPAVRWVALVGLLASTAFTLPTRVGFTFQPLMAPFQDMRLQTRAISAAMVILLFVPALLIPSGWRRRVLPLGLIMFGVFQITFATFEMIANASLKTFLSLPLFIITFVAVAYGVGKSLKNDRSAKVVLWAIVAAMGVMVGAITAQLIVDSRPLFQNSRLMGTTANPQFLATLIAAALVPVIYLLLDPKQPKVSRVALGALTGFLSAFLFWTGSRTGLLMALVGVLVFFRLRIGRLLLAVGITALFILLAVQLFGQEAYEQTDRYLAMSDSRTGVWIRQWNLFRESPMYGSLAHDEGISEGGGENSYLTVAASYGIVGLIPLLLMLISMGSDVVRTWRCRNFVEDKSLVDLVLAGHVAVAVGAFFEGYLLGQFNGVVLMLFIYSSIGAYLRDYARAVTTDPHVAQYELLQPAEPLGPLSHAT